MGKIETVRRVVRDQFCDRLDTEFKEKFRRNLTTEYTPLAMRLISLPTNGKPLTVKQHAWIDGYSQGYSTANDQMRDSAK